MAIRANLESLDVEWMQLMMEAKKIGLTPQQVREFLSNPTNEYYAALYAAAGS